MWPLCQRMKKQSFLAKTNCFASLVITGQKEKSLRIRQRRMKQSFQLQRIASLRSQWYLNVDIHCDCRKVIISRWPMLIFFDGVLDTSRWGGTTRTPIEFGHRVDCRKAVVSRWPMFFYSPQRTRRFYRVDANNFCELGAFFATFA